MPCHRVKYRYNRHHRSTLLGPLDAPKPSPPPYLLQDPRQPFLTARYYPDVLSLLPRPLDYRLFHPRRALFHGGRVWGVGGREDGGGVWEGEGGGVEFDVPRLEGVEGVVFP